MNVTGPRALRLAASNFRSVNVAATATASSSRAASTYTPRRNNRRHDQEVEEIQPRARPESVGHYSGKPKFYSAIEKLEDALTKAQGVMRKEYIWPLPASLPATVPEPPFWRQQLDLTELDMRKNGDYEKLTNVLNEIHQARHVANMAGSYDVAEALNAVVAPYERTAALEHAAARAAKKERKDSHIDDFGRAYGMGRRKESSARVWLIPTQQARELLDAPSQVVDADGDTVPAPLPEAQVGQILINHLPMPQHFGRPCDRENVVRPLRATGLLGAFNVFALTRGGGPTGQAGAVKLALARALAAYRPDAVPALMTDGALQSDGRRTERKKTNRAKARKMYAWVKR